MLINSGVCRPATQEDFPGADVTDRLAVVDWPMPTPHSSAHKDAARAVGAALS